MNEQLKPIERWHRTNIYLGGEGIKPLPVTRVEDENGITLNSIWELPSFWARLKFLFDGRITLRIYGPTLPPVSLIRGDIFGDQQ